MVRFEERGSWPVEANALGKRSGWSGRAWQRASATLYAIANLRSDISGRLEFAFKHSHKTTPKLHFVGEIVATALSNASLVPTQRRR